MKKTELVFVPAPARGHLLSALEFANQLLSRDDRFSVTILLIKLPFQLSLPLLNSHANNLRYVDVPTPEQIPPPELVSESLEKYISDCIESHKSNVKEIVANLLPKPTSFSGLVVDMFCTAMIGVAEELGVPSYVFFTSSAGFLGFILYLGDRDGGVFEESDPESDIPSFANPVPTRVLPSFAFNRRGGLASFVDHAREFKKTKGIIINTVLELESHAVGSFSYRGTPPVYTVGPLLDLSGNMRPERSQDDEKIFKWLDRQSPKSVVFLCFGSQGAFDAPQLREIAIGLEQSGQRFLWSVRKTPPQGKIMPGDYQDPGEFLPHGFLERTKEVGLLCGWVPQVEVLAHKAIGGFVSHCGWNSTLESLWFGVPIATWPMYAEQQMNAFQMVRDLGLAVELRLDYKKDGGDVVTADQIARAVRCLVDGDGEVRRRVEEMSEKCRRAVVDSGSSFVSFGQLIEDVLANVS